MSTAFFDEGGNRHRLDEVLLEWKGTPFMHFGKVAGVGVDCVHLVAEVMFSTGAMQRTDLGYYSLDWGDHNERSLIVDFMEKQTGFVRIPVSEEAVPGDIACFTIGKCVQHAGIVTEQPTFWHVLTQGRVGTARLDDPTWSRRLACFYRRLL